MILRFALGHFPTTSHVCHSNLVHNQEHMEGNVFIPTISEIKKDWTEYSDHNQGKIVSAQTFYFSFLSLMNIPQARNILQIGCGFGNLIPLAVMLKNQNATYLATDLVQNMIETTKKNLKKNFDKYESQLKFQDWCKKQHLQFKIANGEEIISTSKKFDRIICNEVLMITENPEKMLKILYEQAEPGCLLGVSIWGDQNKNPILKFIMDIIKQEGEQFSNMRTEFHLYKRVNQIAQKIGWKLMLQWQQNALIPIVELNQSEVSFQKNLTYFMHFLPQQKRNSARLKIIEKVHQLLSVKKQGLNFTSELYLFKKL